MADEENKQSTTAAEAAPDPDEDDLDDLDEMLEEFSSAKLAPPQPSDARPTPQPGPSGPGRPDDHTKDPNEAQPSTSSRQDADVAQTEGDPDDFAKELEAGMADMMRELESNPDMARQFESMMAQLGGAAGDIPVPTASALKNELKGAQAQTNGASPTPADPSSSRTDPQNTTTDPAADASAMPNFQDTIRQTMERMRQSSANADAASSNANTKSSDPNDLSEDDMMSALFAELAKADPNNPGAAAGNEDSFSQMLLGMMEQLTNKEILYEPMKELDSKYPGWLQDKGKGLKGEDRKRYEEQSQLVKEIVARFEQEGYTDENTEDREYIVERMQKMQAAGAPPPDLVGDMGAAQDFMGGLDSGCPQQ